MKFLFDQNMPASLVERLRDVVPVSFHVRHLRLDAAADTEIWHYAKSENFDIVTQDADFERLSFVLGHPPKVIRVCRPDMSADEMERFLRIRLEQIETFVKDPAMASMQLA